MCHIVLLNLFLIVVLCIKKLGGSFYHKHTHIQPLTMEGEPKATTRQWQMLHLIKVSHLVGHPNLEH
jgi:hypothetical protein